MLAPLLRLHVVKGRKSCYLLLHKQSRLRGHAPPRAGYEQDQVADGLATDHPAGSDAG